MSYPNHLAIIMDGNGRWAQGRGHNRLYGHVRGARIAKSIIEECARLRIGYLTLFTFSTENWRRPPEEVSFLMSLLGRRLRKERKNLRENNIRLQCIGDLEQLPSDVKDIVQKTADETSQNTGMTLVLALNYGGRQEIVYSMQNIARKVEAGELRPEAIDENTINDCLNSTMIPGPDLIVRTSGEHRLSNFYLWQAAYSEFYFSEAPWPEFNRKELHNALNFYVHRERRFGQTSEQIDSVTTPPTT